jgi:hypothetical protein
MEEDDFLLDDARIRQDQSILDMIQWWEKRRLLYNLVVGFVGLLAVVFLSQKQHPVPFGEILWFAALPYALFANVAYLAGWVLELLVLYYFKIALNLSSRQTLLWLGTIISIVPLLFIIIIFR